MAYEKHAENDYKNKFLETSNKFDTIFKLTSAPSKIIDPEFTILYVNQAMVDLLGFSEQEIVGTKILDYSCEDYKEHWHELQEALWHHKMPHFKLEACLISKNKSLVWINVTTILFTENNQPFGFTVFEDITYKKKFAESESSYKQALAYAHQLLKEKSEVEVDLRNNERRLSEILDTMAEGVGIIDLTGKIVYANRMAQEILGIKKEDILNRTYSDPKWKNLRIDGSPLPTEEHPMSKTLSTGKPVFDSEIAVQPPNGERFYVSINAAPLRDEVGNITGGVGTFMNVTERRKTLQLKDEFISTVSHELKTPVTSIKAYTQILKRVVTDYENQSFLERMDVQINRLEQLIKDLLDISRIESNKLVLKNEHIDANILLEEVISDSQLINPTHKLIISVNEPVKIETDKSRLIQVITNLITNAVKYSPEADIVDIQLKCQNGNMLLSVTDFGMGISKKDEHFVFERFHQVEQGGSNIGLGLGLYICKEIITKAGGEIWFESEVGKGTTFYFNLPKCFTENTE